MLAEALAVLAALAPGANAIDACLAAAERRHGLQPGITLAIAQVESGLNPRAINNANRNGTQDVGLMQINSVHLPRLRADYGIEREKLFNPCVNAFAGAQVLAKALERTGGALKPALSIYNTGRPDSSVGAAYAQRVLARWLPPLQPLPPGIGALAGLDGLPDLGALPLPVAPVVRPSNSPLFSSGSGLFTPRRFN